MQCLTLVGGLNAVSLSCWGLNAVSVVGDVLTAVLVVCWGLNAVSLTVVWD